MINYGRLDSETVFIIADILERMGLNLSKLYVDEVTALPIVLIKLVDIIGERIAASFTKGEEW